MAELTSDERREFFRKRLIIDRNDLDKEAAEQPELFHQICEEYVLAASRRDASLDDLKKVFSEQSITIRKKLENEGEKITEARIESLVRATKAHEVAKERWLRLCRNADLWDAFKLSFLQRSTMLKQLAELWVGGYYQNASLKSAQADTREGRVRKAIKDQRKDL